MKNYPAIIAALTGILLGHWLALIKPKNHHTLISFWYSTNGVGGFGNYEDLDTKIQSREDILQIVSLIEAKGNLENVVLIAISDMDSP